MNGLHLRLPATSANLGPGFDALGLALSLWLEIDAHEAPEFSIFARGRDAVLAGSLRRNLILETYRELAPAGPALNLKVTNQIPLGMGCGSSAAALLAGVLLANHFGRLQWSDAQVVDEACRREGHPDNVAACYFGGLTASSMQEGKVSAATLGTDLDWRLRLAIPTAALSTDKARALLPDFYLRSDVVQNIQATALLLSAFALDRPELLVAGTRDSLHQPYRGAACPLLPALAGMAGVDGVASVTLSGAGPSVLLILESSADATQVEQRIRKAAGDLLAEIVQVKISGGAVHTESNVTKVLQR